MGLLDQFADPETLKALQPTDEDRQRALNNALMTAGLAMMQGNRGGRFGAAIGQGGLAGMQQFQDSLQQNQQEKLRQIQLAQTLDAYKTKKDQAAAQQAALANASPEIRHAVAMGVPVDKAFEHFTPQPKYHTVGNNLVQVGPAGASPVFTAPEKLPEWQTLDPSGNKIVNPLYLDMKKQIAAAGRSSTPFYQFLPTANGYAVGDARTGNIAPASIDGKPVVKASDSPSLQADIAGAKEGAKVAAKTQAEAAFDAPRVIQNAEVAIKYADELIKHPGFKQAVGGSSIFGIQKIPGTDAKDFMNRLDQIKGGAFLEAFNSLKGGGQITEVEGKKATDAIARMDNATSEKEFKQAVRDYQNVVRAGMNRAKMRAGNREQQPEQPVAGGAKFLGFE